MSATDHPCILVRADGSAEIGLGHVMRSLTLARALVSIGADVTFLGAGIPSEVYSSLPSDLQVVDRSTIDRDRADASALADQRPDLVVVDGYHFADDFFDELESAGIPYAVIDDNCETAARSPILILNQNPHATAELYTAMRGNPELLLGLEYALIRPEVVELSQQALPSVPGTVFVAMGGSDPAGLTAPIAEAVAASGRAVRVAVGPAHPDREQLVERLGRKSNVSVVRRDEYLHALATSEIAVLAAGSSLWEAACLRTPVIGVIVAENQISAAQAAPGLCGLVDAIDAPAGVEAVRLIQEHDWRGTLPARSGSRDVDGAGVARVGAAIMSMARRLGRLHDDSTTAPD